MKKITLVISITLVLVLVGMAMLSKRQNQVAVNKHIKSASKANGSATWHKGMDLQEAMEQKISLSGEHVKQSNEFGDATLEAETDGGEERMASSSDSEEEREREGRRNNFKFTRRLKLTQDSIGKVVIKASDTPMAGQLIRSGKSFAGDLRTLPKNRAVAKERPEREGPAPNPFEIEPTSLKAPQPLQKLLKPTKLLAPAPAAILGFEGLDRQNWGAGSPPDTTGDVGPNHYIQAVNSSVGIFDKTNGNLITAFTFDTLMSQGNFGNQCDTENFGDPVVLYDTFEDRWILTDFAFTLDGGGNVNPPIAFQCFAVSKTGDPVNGGWNFYSTTVTDALNDYPKLGVWTDGIYMSANLFGFPAGSSFQGVRTWAFNKAQMYAGAPTAQSVSFNVGGGDFTIIPSNARLQTGTPPAGRPNLFVSTWLFLNSLTVYKFHVDWAHPSLATFTGPDAPLAATSWPNAAVANAPQSGTATLLDVLQIRAMVQNQYTNYSGTESIWTTHTVRRANTTGFAAPRWYQVNVTGGTVAANLPQAATWDPDGANTFHRFMPSLALDRAGNMALGYSKSSSTTFPSFSYAGRLAADPVNTFSLTEQNLFTGTASQTGTTRWGDYSSMMLDPDGCTFWYTTEYANPASQAFDMRWKTRVNSFSYASIGQCTPVGAGGTISGTVTVTPGGAPISGATVALGSRTATTNGSGFYQFLNIPAGTYPSITASAVGYNSSTATNIVVTDGNTTAQDFSLATAPLSACPTDTTQLDFQSGVPTAVDLVASPGDVILAKPSLDQQNGTLGTSGVGITITTWGGQTFTPAVTGTLTKVDVNLFCSGCTGTTPNLTLSVRATSAGLPTGADLATATITGFSSGSSAYYTGTFGVPPTLTAGTQYALVIRPTANPSPGTYALTRSGTSTLGSDVYAGGTRVSGATSGTVWSIPLTGGVSTDAGFRTYMDSGFFASGNLVSATKDANPATGLTTHWTTLSWTASTPANTSVKFQVAGSNNPAGPFNFVGPDTTAATFFTTSGASLSQFNGLRYLQYKAYLATTDTAVTPTLNDVTVCYVNGAAPTFTTCPTNQTVNADIGACTAAVAFNPVAGGPPSPTITCKIGATTITSPFNFPVGTSNVVCTATNGFAPDATCSFSVTVNDTQLPTVICPANITTATASGQCSAVVNYTTPMASDNCSGATVTCVPAAGSTFNIGTTTVTCTPKDASNNTGAACTFTVTVNDTQPPTVVCPANITTPAAANQCSAVVTYTTPTASDNCTGATVTCAPASGSTFNVGTTTVTCTPKDAANNTGTACTFTVTVNDTQPPTIGACPANITVNANSPTVVTYTSPTASDNCSGATVTCAPASGSSFAVGTTTVTCTSKDAANNTGTSCSFTVMITPCAITCPANVTAWTSNTSAPVTYSAPTTSGSCGTVTCTPASGSSFNVGTTTVTCSTTSGPSCSFTVTVNKLALGATLDDPLACAGPGDKVNGSFSATNTTGASASVSLSATLSNIAYLPNTASASLPGPVVVLSNVISWTGTLGAGQTVTVSWMGQIVDTLTPGGQACSVTTATVNSLPVAGNASACITANCPTPGPGGIFPTTSEASDQKAGSVLLYNVYTSGATSGNTQNTRINITNSHPTRPSFVHLFFVAEGCSIADSYICLTGNQTASFLASDLDPGTTGYLVAVAVDGIRGCPTSHNYLIGDEYVKFTSGHAANLGAIAFSQLAGGLPLCDGNSVTATLNFDGVSYNRTPAALALDSIGSRADGNDTLVILNRIGGNLGIGASTLGTLFGVFYDDAENSLSFSVSGNCQLRNSISNNFPRTTPRFETFIPAGRTGWAKVFNQTGAIGITGSAINFNSNAASSAGAFNQGHNLHVLTLTNAASYVIPVFPPSC